MGAKEKWLAGDVPAARNILQKADAAIPKYVEIWLAAFKLEFENNEPERVRMLLAKACERGGTGRVWMKSAIVERELGNSSKERRLLDEGLRLFLSFFKLWLMLGQLEQRLGCLPQANHIYDLGLKQCLDSTPLWLSLANLEERMSGLSKFEPSQSTDLNKKADILMAKLLQECPNSAAIGKLFWHVMKVNNARDWLNWAFTVAPDVGDFWALVYKFELQHGTEDQLMEVLRNCVPAEPKHGLEFASVPGFGSLVNNNSSSVNDMSSSRIPNDNVKVDIMISFEAKFSESEILT
ncbi:protein STABILIZED1-like [Bidens hawaiensis]|uniref:protein STABILIZED1-like n=1 Tax=Bidens hawaiensis TaxID=980011 RepID=UPI00404AE656